MLNTLRNLTATQWIMLGVATAGFLNASTAQLTEWFGAKVAHDIISGIGFIQGLVGAWVVALTSQGSVIKQVLAMPGVDKIDINANANSTLAAIAIDPKEDKIAPTPAAMQQVTATANAG
jgi:hypothetical protein